MMEKNKNEKPQKLVLSLKTEWPMEYARFLRRWFPEFDKWYREPRGLCIVLSDSIRNFTSPDGAFCLIVSTEQDLRDLETAFLCVPLPRFIAYIPHSLEVTAAYKSAYEHASLVIDQRVAEPKCKKEVE